MKIGDHVSVLDDDLAGTITSVHGETVVFRDTHGFTHQYQKNQLVLQNPSIYEGLEIEVKKEMPKKSSKKHNKKPLILDLHFDNIVKDTSRYSSFERLFMQREKLIETLDFCRKNHLKNLEVIHGIGDGVLQQMVHDVLSAQTGLEYYNNAILHHESGSVTVKFD